MIQSLAVFVSYALLTAMLAAWVLLLLRKTGVLQWMQTHGCDLIYRLATCDFCLSWWACVAVCLFAFAATFDWRFLAVPFFASPVTRLML